MRKRFSTVVIKVLSLGIGLAVGIVLIAQVCFQFSYDKWIPDLERVYQIRTAYEQQGDERDYSNVSGAIAPAFKAEVPGVEEATRFTWLFDEGKYIDGDKHVISMEDDAIAIDSSFFKIVQRAVLAGDLKELLGSWSGKVAISRRFAEQLGGIQEAIGKSVCNKESKRKWKLSLLFLQFTINTVLLVIVLVAGGQYRRMLGSDVGYEPEGLVYTSLRQASVAAWFVAKKMA